MGCNDVTLATQAAQATTSFAETGVLGDQGLASVDPCGFISRAERVTWRGRISAGRVEALPRRRRSLP